MLDKMHDFSSVGVQTPKYARTVFPFKPHTKTSFNQGQLVPLGWWQVIPGDQAKFDLAAFVRMAAQPLKPVLDDCFLDCYCAFVPQRLLWQHWESMHGANSDPYAQTTEYIVPTMSAAGTGYTAKIRSCGLLDYLGIPQVGAGRYNGVSLLPVAAYCKIWNDWFRDENYQTAVDLDSIIYKLENGYNWMMVASGGIGVNVPSFHYYNWDGSSWSFTSSVLLDQVSCLPVNRYHDYFSSCLPQPQKGEPIQLPLGGSAKLVSLGDPASSDNVYSLGNAAYVSGLEGGTQSALKDYSLSSSSSAGAYSSTNLVADLSTASGATIQDFVYAMALQKQLIRDNVGGTRYYEVLKSNFGVAPLDTTLGRSEILGAIHTPLNMTAVPQTNVAQDSSASVNNATGAVGAMSATGVHSRFVNKIFTEYGYMMIVACVRVKHSYSQGIDAQWFDTRRFNFFYPAFSNIGEQPVYCRELTALPNSQSSDGEIYRPNSVFGYQEAWAYLKYFPDRITGNLRKGAYADFAAWTYGDYYEKVATASATWLFEGQDTIGNTTALGGSAADGTQFIADFQCDGVMVRPIPANTQLRLTDLR